MWTYYPELLEQPVPRYTSYPTAADFGDIPSGALRNALARASGEVSLYVHIPFCEQICFYCGCNTAAAGRRQRVGSYLSALHNEIATIGVLLSRGVSVRRVAFGGGSPNAIYPSEFLDLIDALHDAFGLDGTDLSIELDPRTMTADWAAAIGSAGVTRASMGVQTFAPHCQRAIGREQSDTMIWRSTEWLRNAGVTSLNFDLMYGLPYQSHDDLLDSLENTRQFGAERVALFGYAHVPHIVKRQKAIDAAALPDAEMRFDMARSGFEFLTSNSYHPVGFDHFALPDDPMAIAAQEGTLRRNFQGFTDDPSDSLIGLGASAISGFPELIVQNEKNSGRYRMLASQGQLTGTHGVARAPQDRMNAAIIEDLLCRGRTRLSPCQLASHSSRLQPFIARDLAKIDGLDLSVTAAGRPYSRVIASIFDRFRQTSQVRFSSAV
ncbi:Coproporphyrinogen dehydrogenase [Altererythrobacter insulae]|nr:Coproporphyrinogen dehydrogenase [Altererythrobacter insulae]